MAINYIKFQRGTLDAYNTLKEASRLDENTLYFIYPEGNDSVGSLYMGERIISGGDIVLETAYLDDLKDVVATGAETNSFLVRDGENWVAKTLEDVIDLIIGNVSLSETQVFQVDLIAEETHDAAIARITAGAILAAGDIVIVRNEFVEGKFEHSAYVYDAQLKTWAAMDGNYSAENVYFNEDFVFTKAIGTVTIPASGSKTVEAAGKNLKEFFAALFAAEETTGLIKTNPSVSSLTISGAGAYEVGAVLTPTYSAGFEDGSYKYGPDPTGVVVSNWEITSTAGDNISGANANNGTLAEITINENTVYSVTAKATYGAGDFAKTNLGNISTIQIPAGNKTKTASSAITGFRNTFYGTFENKGELTNDLIRGLTHSGATLANGAIFDVNIPVGAIRVVVAYPATLQDMSSANDVNGMGAQVKDSFVKETMAISGLNGADPIEYKVYICDFAEPIAEGKANTYTITI